MIIGHGIDIVDIDRFDHKLSQTPQLKNRLFTDAERQLNTASLAARFAAKEAVIKALKVPSGLNWQHIEIIKDIQGAPYISLSGKIQEYATNLGVQTWHLSLSHDTGSAIASVIAEK